jgi:FkbH-like protein
LKNDIILLPENTVKYMNRNKINASYVSNQSQRTWLRNKLVYMVGGCELSYIRDYLRTYEMGIIHSFENGTSSDPLGEFSNKEIDFYKKKPHMVILSQAQLIRSLIEKSNKTESKDLGDEIDSLIQQLDISINMINSTYENIPIFVMTYPYADIPINGINKYKYSDTPRLLLLKYKYLLYNRCKNEINKNLYLLDTDVIWSKYTGNTDIIRCEVNGSHPERGGALLVGEEIIKVLYSIDSSRPRIKCIVLDCDNTLWDGIIREDGGNKVVLRKKYIEILYMLSERGILLCLCSKNDPGEIQTIENILKVTPAFRRNIVCSKINWNPKSENIKEISEILNIGLDSIAFIDDSEFERNEVMSQHPMVYIYNDKQIPDLPYMSEFEPITNNVTEDSKSRIDFYKTESKRHLEQKTAITNNVSYEKFLETTGLKISFSEGTINDVDRILEIFARTNQLNATMKRTSRDDIIKYLKASEYKVYKFEMSDKFGAYGVIGATILKFDNNDKLVVNIEEFALSCRGMGRKAENAFLVYIFKKLETVVEAIRILVAPTKKNHHLIQTLVSASFQHKEVINETNSLYEAKIKDFDKTYPPWFTVEEK